VRALAGLILAGLSLTAAAAASLPVQGERGQLAQANAALQSGEADKALGLLDALAQPGGPAAAYNLRCRVRFTLEQWDQAATDCAQAVRLDGGSADNQQKSDDQMWLARALGEKASRASFLNAYSLAKRVRIEFEEAVQLNPRNADALADLGEYYYSAPEVLGGGLDKAERVATQLEGIDAARAHVLRGNIAVARKDYGTAERELKQAIAESAHPASQWIALAGFYRSQGRWTEMESAVRSGDNAAQRDRSAGVALFDGASMLIKTNRDPARAARMLENYLASSTKTEEAPAFVAHTRLARLKAQLGDAAGANRERAAALALASEYQPARDLKLPGMNSQDQKH
jgi:tetratricopeptide (TPR) repeat protein